MKKLIILFFIPIIIFSKPLIIINVHAPEYSEIFYANVQGIFGENKFEILLKDALKKLGFEVKLQDLLSGENIILSENVQSPLVLNLYLKNFSVTIQSKEKFFLENNASGNYINVNGKYIKVYVGKWYDANGGKDGIFVKGYDGNLYSATSFFTKFYHILEYFIVKGKIYYNFAGKDGEIEINKKIKKSWYEWNESIQSPIKKENSFFIDQIAETIAYNLLNKLKYNIKANVVALKDNRVVLDVGKNDGVKLNTVFSVDEKAQVIVRNVEKNFSEAEVIYLKKGEKIIPKDLAKESSKMVSLPFELGIYYSTEGLLFSFGLVQKNIHNEKIAFLDIKTSDFKISRYDMGFRIFDFEKFGVFLTYSINAPGILLRYQFLDFFIKFNKENYTIGGGISW
ncbi:hypothetical protein XJ44_02945 [Thermosipho affectus]|uniref:POTRA domain-containing protein n=1 Tax=Thermosipho affectus TaxID=660294 RepID=A0ABX3IJT6_9BACT|nr:hypothetical protein [Thermosipho affectus]ONN27593.1 hypothetical protein XJ44_02945 [Thermosipho affectus]